jgi:hypothetical protein
MANVHAFSVHQSSMADCTKAAALVDWIYWTQTSDDALQIARQCVPSSERLLDCCYRTAA